MSVSPSIATPPCRLAFHLQPRKFDIRDVPIPTIKDDEILLKGQYLPTVVKHWAELTGIVDICGVCGTDVGHSVSGSNQVKIGTDKPRLTFTRESSSPSSP